MADEVIQYVFDGDSSRLQKATQDAINSLTLYENTVKSIQSNMNGLMSGINNIADWVKLFANEMKSLVQITNMASDAFKNVKNSSTQYANAMRSVADAQRRNNSALSDTNKKTEDAGNTAKNSSNKWKDLAEALVQLEKSFSLAKRSTKEISNTIKDIASVAGSATVAIKTLFGIDIAGTFGKAAEASMDYIESLNLFNVAMGDSVEYGKSFVSQMQEVYGLDPTNIMNYVGNFNQLASAMEMPAETAFILSTNMVKMSTDLASLFNMDVVKVVNNMKSGLMGMSRAVTKYGMDIRATTLQQTALSLGIAEDVRYMSEANREGLRYITMMRQASNVSGDWAKTIESPSNQLKILKEQLTQLARAIGNIFLPVISKILPYVNGFVMAMREAVQAIASFFGFVNMDFGGTTSGIEDMSDSITGVGNEADKTAKKLQKLIAPFDKLNVIQESSSENNSAEPDSEVMDPAIVGAINALNVPLENIRMKANDVRDALLEVFNLNGGSLERILTRIKNTATNIKDIFVVLGKKAEEALTFNSNGEKILSNIKGLLSDIWNWFDLIIADTKAWAEDLDLTPLTTAFANLSEAVRNLAGVIGDKLESVYKNVMLPLSKWTIEEALPGIIQAIADALNWFAEHPDIAMILLGVAMAFSIIFGVVRGVINIIKVLGPIMTGAKAIFEVFGSTAVASAAPIIGTILGIIAGIIALIVVIVLVITHLDEIKAWFSNIYSQYIEPVFNAIKNAIAYIRDLLQPLFDFIKIKLAVIWAKLQPAIAVLKVVFKTISNIIKTIISNVVTVVKKVIEIIKTIISVVKALWGAFKTYVIDPVKDWFLGLYYEHIKPIVDKILYYINYVGDFLYDVFYDAAAGIANVFIWLINLVIGMFEGMFNGVISIINNIVKAANKVPGVNINTISKVSLSRVEYLAEGGVVSGPTQAVIGEGRYDEAVIPLGNSPQLESMLNKFADKVNERPINVKVQIGDSQWDAFTYRSAKRGEQQLGKPIVGGNISG